MAKTENHYVETDLGNISPNPRGEYDPEAAYEYLDLVAYEGGSYLCMAELGATVTGTAPEPGETTETWQCIALPGDRTPEYIAMHDEVVKLSAQAGESALEAGRAAESAETAAGTAGAAQKASETAAVEAEASKDQAAGYARKAEESGQAAEAASEEAIKQVSGFDQRVKEKTAEAEQAVDAARREAVSAVADQQKDSVQVVKDQTAQYIEEKQQAAEAAIQGIVDGFDADVEQIKSAVREEGSRQAEAVATAGTSQVEAVCAAGAEQTEAVAEAGTAQAAAVKAEGSKQTQAVQAEGQAQTAAVQEAAAEIKADREQIRKNQEGIAQIQDEMEDLAPVIIQRGRGEVIRAYGSAERKLRGMRLYGKSRQVETAGVQLLDFPQGNLEKNGVSFQVNSDGSITIDGTNTSEDVVQYMIRTKSELSPGKYTYKLNGSREDGGVYTNVYFVGDVIGNAEKNFEASDDRLYGVFLMIKGNAVVDNLVVRPMLNQGNTALPFEPYTGGQPSPSPEYPQEIENAGKKGKIKAEIFGANLLDINGDTNKKVGTFEITDDAINCTLQDNYGGSYIMWDKVYPPGEYTAYLKFFKNGEETPPAFLLDTAPSYLMNEDDFLSRYNEYYKNHLIKAKASGRSTIVFKCNDSFKIGIAFSANDDQAGEIISLRNPMIVPGTKEQEYETYKDVQSIDVTTPNGLPGIPVDSGGNYTDESGQQWVCDEVDFERGKYVQRIGTESISGNWKLKETSDYPGRYLQNSLSIAAYKLGTEKSMCNIATWRSWGHSSKKLNWVFAVSGSLFYISPPFSTSAEQLNEQLNSLDIPVVFWGQLAEPVETDLTPEEIAAYRALHTNYSTTVVTTDTDPQAGIEMEYTADTKCYIQSIQNELQEQITAIQAAMISENVRGGV